MRKFNALLSWSMTAVLLFYSAHVFASEKIALIQTQTKPGHISNELLVQFKSDVVAADQSQIIAATGAKVLHRLGKQQRFTRIKLREGQTLQQALSLYQADPNVASVQPNYLYYAQTVPNDTDYIQLWGLSNPNPTGYDIDAELAWDHITNCNSNIVAVLDTGVDYTHQDLATNMWDGTAAGFPNHGYDYIGDSVFNATQDYDPIPMGAVEEHGTHVAGTIAAVGNNNNGITGVCWQAQIMSVRVLDSLGTGSTASIIQGIHFAVDHGAKIINMSLGYQEAYDQALSDAISYARDNDVVVVVAAGNEGADNELTEFYPCNFTQPNLICVAALDQDYSLAFFSNYGVISVDVAAPGVDIFSTVPTGQAINANDSNEGITQWETNNGHWTTVQCSFDINSIPTPLTTLVNPSSWCDVTPGTYVAVADDNIYKTFDLSGSGTQAALFYQPFIETESNADFFLSGFDSTGGDPFDGDPDNVELLSFSGANDAANSYFIHDLTDCLTGTCSIGFRLTSDGDADRRSGVGIPIVVISTLDEGGNTFVTSQGTSMATPHVAGIAAMVRAYNPNYTYADTVAAIKQGGEYVSALDGITSTSNAANAMGSLSYINPPTGLTAVVE